jgi:hypothetical protein
MKIKSAALLTLTVFFGSGLVYAKSKKHADLPDIFRTAHTVFVESPAGDITNLSLDRDDRNAILDMQDAIQESGRYTLSRSRYDADLIFVVRKGRLERDQPTNNIPTRTPPRTPMQSPADASQSSPTGASPDGYSTEKDKLSVYILQPNGKLKNPIWTGEMERGLEGTKPMLLQRLIYDVNKSFPPAPAQKTP